MAKNNTTLKGNELRDRVYKLCVAAGMRNVEREYSVGGKSADVYFEDVRGFDGTKRFAVECKHYAKQLGENEWTAIYSGYSSRRGSFDRLLIISEVGVTQNFREGVKANSDWVTELTWQKFLFHLIDFRSYFQSISLLRNADNLMQYYVPPLDVDQQDLEELIKTWIDGNSNQPLAFLAGYGMGKSSLAKYLASTMGPKFEDGSFDRIPVYIKLGGLFDQQNIDSLITHYFTSEHQIASMTPSLFKEMNRLGLLLLIFDGFDEMKHGMTFKDFKHIFSQIKKLVEGQARVMVLGRPSALTSDSDRSVLFGNHEDTVNPIVCALQDEVTFKEIQIAEFNDDQLKLFVPNFLKSLNCELQLRDKGILPEDMLETRAQDVLADKFRALIRRPVHAQMLCRIALFKPDVKLTQTSTYELYQSFVLLIIEREVEKPARYAIDRDQRLSFITDTAWYFWPDKGLTGFTLDQLKAANFSLPEKQKPNDDIYREMLVGSLLERKFESLYYFSHRSFQEYLVAQYIISSSSLLNDIEKVNRDFTSEILVFVRESAHIDEVAKKVFEALGSLNRPINTKLLKLFEHIDFKAFSIHIDSLVPSNLTPKQCFIAAEIHYRYAKGFLNLKQLHNGECRAAALMGLMKIFGDVSYALELRSVLSFILYFSKPLVQKANSTKDKLRNQIVLKSREESIWAKAFLSLESRFNTNKEFVSLTIDSAVLFKTLNKKLNAIDGDWEFIGVSHEATSLDGLLKTVIEQMEGKGNENDFRHSEYRKELIQFLRTNPSDSSFVFDQSKPAVPETVKVKRETLSLKPR
jgi:predicted NACHT family NTPase